MIPKKDALALLLHAPIVRVVLDSKMEGVVLPDYLLAEGTVALDIGNQLPVPIDDLQVDDDGFVATLSFNRTPFRVRVPWPAVLAMAVENQAQLVWPPEPEKPAPPRKRPTLRAV